MKKTISAILTLLLLVGTISPVMALNLKNYPDFLVDNNKVNTYVVVGSDASPEDVIGAVDLAVRLAGENTEKVDLPKSIEMIGGKEEEIPLGEKLTYSGGFSSTLDDSDVKGLKDSSVDFFDDNIDYHEEIRLGLNSPSIETSLTSGEDDYEDNIVMEVERGAISYYLVFDDDVNLTKSTESDPMEIDFLGRRINIIDVKDSNTFVVQTGKTYFLEEGSTQTVEGKTVKLISVGDNNKVMIDVDGTREIISDITKEVNGLKMKVLSVFEGDTDFAEVVIGNEVSETYNDGDAFIDEDEDDPNWVWVLNNLDTDKPIMGIENDFVRNDEGDKPVREEQCYKIPMNYTQICFAETNVDDSSYETYELEYDHSADLDEADNSGMLWGSSEQAFVLESLSSEKGLLLDWNSPSWVMKGTKFTEDKETNRIYLFAENVALGDTSVFFRDKNNDVVFAGKIRNDALADDNLIGYLNYRDTRGIIELRLVGNLVANGLRFVYHNNVLNDDISVHLHHNGARFNSIGNTADTSEASEVMWTTVNIGTKDNDLRTLFGAVIQNPDSKGASDRLIVKFPEERIKVKVTVMGTESVVTETSEGYYEKSVPIVNAVAKLDTEIPNPESISKHMILVGDGAVNRLSARVRGISYPTYGSSGLYSYGEGEGEIAVFENGFKEGYNVVLVAGWSAGDTRRGCLALMDFSNKLKDLDTNSAKITSSGLVPM